MIAGLGIGLNYCWSRSRTKSLGKHPVLVSKKLSGLDLEAGGLDYNTATHIKMSVSKLQLRSVVMQKYISLLLRNGSSRYNARCALITSRQ